MGSRRREEIPFVSEYLRIEHSPRFLPLTQASQKRRSKKCADRRLVQITFVLFGVAGAFPLQDIKSLLQLLWCHFLDSIPKIYQR